MNLQGKWGIVPEILDLRVKPSWNSARIHDCSCNSYCHYWGARIRHSSASMCVPAPLRLFLFLFLALLLSASLFFSSCILRPTLQNPKRSHNESQRKSLKKENQTTQEITKEIKKSTLTNFICVIHKKIIWKTKLIFFLLFVNSKNNYLVNYIIII
jgi:hypothetical protein